MAIRNGIKVAAALALGPILATVLTLGSPAAFGQSWPTKPVRIVLQFPTGGSTDAVARILAQSMAQSLGQPVIIDNKPGADASCRPGRAGRAGRAGAP